MSWRAGCSGIGACRALLPMSTQTSAEDTVIILEEENTKTISIATLEPLIMWLQRQAKYSPPLAAICFPVHNYFV